MKLFFITILTVLSWNLLAQSNLGPYAPEAGQSGSTAIHKDSSVFVSWATHSVIERGWQNIADTSFGKTTTGNDTSATDKAGINGVVSLGDAGKATLTFNGVIYDGAGYDFAVFENGFGNFFELAYVEVSSDGVNFFRFDAVSLTDTSIQVSSFGSLDPTNINNLAGKYTVGYGVPFDLNELSGISGLNINSISHVRVVDVVGTMHPLFRSYDSQNNPVNDPYPTAFPTGGFDLDAVGVIHLTQPTSIDESFADNVSMYPNPVKDYLNLSFASVSLYTITIRDISGKLLSSSKVTDDKITIDMAKLKAGIYFVTVYNHEMKWNKRLIKQ